MILGLYVTIFKDPANICQYAFLWWWLKGFFQSRHLKFVCIRVPSVNNCAFWCPQLQIPSGFVGGGKCWSDTQGNSKSCWNRQPEVLGCKRTWRSYKPPANPFYDLIPPSCREPKFMQQIPNLLWCISSPWNRWVHPLSLSFLEAISLSTFTQEWVYLKIGNSENPMEYHQILWNI